jgi:protein TonB
MGRVVGHYDALGWSVSGVCHLVVLGGMVAYASMESPYTFDIQSGKAAIELTASMEARREKPETVVDVAAEVEPEPLDESVMLDPEASRPLEVAVAELPFAKKQAVETPPEDPKEETPPEPEPAETPQAANESVASPASQAIVGADVDEEPRQLSSNLPPAYPPDAYARRVEGSPNVRALIGTDGAVKQVWLHESCGHASLDRYALDAVSRWRFTPGRKGGVPVECQRLFRVNFYF